MNNHLASSRIPLPAAIALLLAVCTFACSTPPEGNTADAGADAGGFVDASPDGNTPLLPGKLGLISVTPNRGPLEGGDAVDLLGQEFTVDTRVFFGTEEATIDWRAGSTHLYVISPPQKVPGQYDVRVVGKNGETAQLAGAFTYLGQVDVHDVAPALGPHTGGTVIEIRGDGFSPGDKVLVGYRECLDTQVVDRNTIVAVTPPASMAPHQHKLSVLVSVRHASGIAHLTKVFTYGRPPHIDHVVPNIVDPAGEAAILHGRALGNTKRLFANDILATLSPGSASSSRGVQLPAATAIGKKAGNTVPLLADSAFGASTRDPGYAYAAGKATLHGVSPAFGSTEGGEKVAVIVELDGATVESVAFDGDIAVHVVKDGILFATTPKHAAGPVEVTVKTSAGTLSKANAYTYQQAPKLKVVSPGVGPVAGGNQVQLSGSGFAEGCTVRIGAYPAKITDLGPTGILVTARTWLNKPR